MPHRRSARRSALEHTFLTALGPIRQSVRRIMDRELGRLGLSIAQAAPLAIIEHHDGIRQGELAERLDIAPAFASNLIKGLVKSKYLKRDSDASDGRVTILKITPAGRAVCDRIDDEVKPHVDYFTSQLTNDERETALSTLMFYVGPGAGTTK
jgi:DNA-binding MarR family transcriptional regulator